MYMVYSKFKDVPNHAAYAQSMHVPECLSDESDGTTNFFGQNNVNIKANRAEFVIDCGSVYYICIVCTTCLLPHTARHALPP